MFDRRNRQPDHRPQGHRASVPALEFAGVVRLRERGLVHGCGKTLCYSRPMILDSLCITSWRARPVSFTSLMTLYESNFIRLQALVGDVRRHVGSKVSSVAGDCDLHLE